MLSQGFSGNYTTGITRRANTKIGGRFCFQYSSQPLLASSFSTRRQDLTCDPEPKQGTTIAKVQESGQIESLTRIVNCGLGIRRSNPPWLPHRSPPARMPVPAGIFLSTGSSICNPQFHSPINWVTLFWRDLRNPTSGDFLPEQGGPPRLSSPAYRSLTVSASAHGTLSKRVRHSHPA